MKLGGWKEASSHGTKGKRVIQGDRCCVIWWDPVDKVSGKTVQGFTVLLVGPGGRGKVFLFVLMAVVVLRGGLKVRKGFELN